VLLEHDAVGGDRVDHRGDAALLAVGAQVIGAQRVDGDQQDVGLGLQGVVHRRAAQARPGVVPSRDEREAEARGGDRAPSAEDAGALEQEAQRAVEHRHADGELQDHRQPDGSQDRQLAHHRDAGLGIDLFVHHVQEDEREHRADRGGGARAEGHGLGALAEPVEPLDHREEHAADEAEPQADQAVQDPAVERGEVIGRAGGGGLVQGLAEAEQAAAEQAASGALDEVACEVQAASGRVTGRT
jgi:hypothetical protein